MFAFKNKSGKQKDILNTLYDWTDFSIIVIKLRL